MSLENSLVALADRVIILAAGIAVAWMGYRLLASGLYERAVKLKETSAAEDLLWKQVLPGTLFTLFAGVVIVVGLRQPVFLAHAPLEDLPVELPGTGHPLSERGEHSPFPVVTEAGSMLAPNEFDSE